VLDQLESVGAIERSRNPANRRAYVLSVTEHGRALAAPSLSRWLSSWDERLAGFTEPELDVATRVVAAISEIFDAAPQCGVADPPPELT
jgi:DNA-binding MarR family transcriptional regulator